MTTVAMLTAGTTWVHCVQHWRQTQQARLMCQT